MQASSRSSEDLPDPDGPTTTVTRARGIASVTPSSAVTDSVAVRYVLTTSRHAAAGPSEGSAVLAKTGSASGSAAKWKPSGPVIGGEHRSRRSRLGHDGRSGAGTLAPSPQGSDREIDLAGQVSLDGGAHR